MIYILYVALAIVRLSRHLALRIAINCTTYKYYILTFITKAVAIVFLQCYGNLIFGAANKTINPILSCCFMFLISICVQSFWNFCWFKVSET